MATSNDTQSAVPVDALVSLLDPIVWQAHFLVRLPECRDALTFEVPVSRKDWNRYWRKTRSECRGYWHGATGRIAERLGFLGDDEAPDDGEWLRMVRFHQPEPPTCLGDSSHDYGYLMKQSAVCAG